MPSTGQPALKVTGNQARGRVRGTSKPGATIEAINLSSIPTQRFHQDDTFALAKVGADGKFDGKMDMKAGDFIRLRATSGSSHGKWVTIRAEGLGKDTRNAEVELKRVGLRPRKDGHVDVVNVNSSRPISEPHARLMFVNERTGDRTLVVLDDEGTFEKGVKLDGRAGDTFKICASDGVNNKSFAASVGKVTVAGGKRGDNQNDLVDPRPDAENKGCDVARFTGFLFDRAGADATDVTQGNLGDCFLLSGMGGLVDTDDELFPNIIKKNADGNYDVTFKVWDERRGRFVKKIETVDGDLYVRSDGTPMFGTDDGSQAHKKMEMWVPIFEKAYAQLMGGFHKIGAGAATSDVFTAVLGKHADDHAIEEKNVDAFWNTLVRKKKAKLPVCLGTYGDRQARRYRNTGVYSDHSYSVLDYKVKADGTRMVQLRNPWGESEPYPGDRKNDGIFWIQAETAAHLFETLYSVRA